MAQVAAASESKEKESVDDGCGAIRTALVTAVEKMTVADLGPKTPIILDSATDVRKALEVCLSNKIMAAPVVESGKFIGVLDLRDTVKFALEEYNRGSVDKLKAKAMEFLAVSPLITTTKLSYLAKMRPFRCVKETDNAMSVVAVLAKGSHIVGVTDGKGHTLKGILTQGMVFQGLAKSWKFEKEDTSIKNLMALKVVTSPVITVASSLKAAQAFEKMTLKGLSGLAVVNEAGKIIHNTSATDIKLWLLASNSLESPIEQFLIAIRKLSIEERYPITTCGPSDTLGRAVAKLVATRYHRMWIIDEVGRPIGVLALTDIFKFILQK